MKTELVGYTGFVGSNLNEQCMFDGVFNSKNIEEAYGTCPDLLVYSGVPAQKFIANNDPKRDMEIIEGAINNIKKINPKEVVLISTIDVYKKPIDVNEDTFIDKTDLQPYGYDRYILEKWVTENYKNHLIVRLPGLYGKNIKKNFLYDLINIIPSMLKEEKYDEIVEDDNFIKDFYVKQENGFYKLKDVDNEQRKVLKEHFENSSFNALNFTDSRGEYQFYNLKYLWNHINTARKNGIRLLNLATEPVSVSEIYEYVKKGKFENRITDCVPKYNFKTKYDYLYKGAKGYIFDKTFILEDIKAFVECFE